MMHSHVPETIFASLVFALLLPGCSSDSPEPANKGAAVVAALDPADKQFGKSYADWGSAWWKWYYEDVARVRPLRISAMMVGAADFSRNTIAVGAALDQADLVRRALR